jgi:hypothetical protein
MTATFRYLRAGEMLFEGFEQTDHTVQDYADWKAVRTNPRYADTVQVWFGPLDDRDPDATAEVPA